MAYWTRDTIEAEGLNIECPIDVIYFSAGDLSRVVRRHISLPFRGTMEKARAAPWQRTAQIRSDRTATAQIVAEYVGDATKNDAASASYAGSSAQRPRCRLEGERIHRDGIQSPHVGGVEFLDPRSREREEQAARRR